MAIISLNLGILNLLPIPILMVEHPAAHDGSIRAAIQPGVQRALRAGRIVFLLCCSLTLCTMTLCGCSDPLLGRIAHEWGIRNGDITDAPGFHRRAPQYAETTGKLQQAVPGAESA